MNWRGCRGNLYYSFTDGFTVGYKINYYFNLFRRWSVNNPSMNFEFRTKIFNYPPYFSWAVGNFVGNLTRLEMHLMHNPLEFVRFVSNFVGKLDRRQFTDGYISVGMDVGDCDISCYSLWNADRFISIRRYGRRWLWHFKQLFCVTLYEIPTDLYPSVWTSVIVVFQVIISCYKIYHPWSIIISSNYFVIVAFQVLLPIFGFPTKNKKNTNEKIQKNISKKYLKKSKNNRRKGCWNAEKG